MDPSTGLSGLDKILHGVRPGDNIVWQSDSPEDFLPFVSAFCKHALEAEVPLVYFRFAKHRELIAADCGSRVVQVHQEVGFETSFT